MASITTTDKPVWWAVRQGDETVAAGITEVGAFTGTNNALDTVYDTDEGTFLGKAAGKAGGYNPLPDSGWLNAGEIYAYGDGLVIVRQSHWRTIHAPADAPALFTVYRANQTDVLDWIAGEQVYVGTRRKYNGKVYECLQKHVTQVDWTPDKTPALWREVIEKPPTGAWAVGVAYKVDDQVTYNVRLYKCLQAHTSIQTWNPLATINVLWKDIGAAP